MQRMAELGNEEKKEGEGQAAKRALYVSNRSIRKFHFHARQGAPAAWLPRAPCLGAYLSTPLLHMYNGFVVIIDDRSLTMISKPSTTTQVRASASLEAASEEEGRSRFVWTR